jgi:hypothetical protein
VAAWKRCAVTEECECPIWGTPATVLSEDYGFRNMCDSPRAGGQFVLLGEFRNWGTGLDEVCKAKLTTWIFEQNRVGEVPQVDGRRLEDIRSYPRLSPSERSDRLLEFLASRQRYLGDHIRLADEGNGVENHMQALAASESTNSRELRFLLTSLSENGLISGRTSSTAHEAMLTLAGHDRLAAIATANQDSAQAFVAMWFHETTQEAYGDGIEPAIREVGFRPLRIDRKETIGKVDDEIVAEIRRSRFVVADFTSEPNRPRGGVYFEAGFAMGLNIPVVWTCQIDLIDQVHFDTRQFSHIVWSEPQDLKVKLRNRIRAVIGQGPLVTE